MLRALSSLSSGGGGGGNFLGDMTFDTAGNLGDSLSAQLLGSQYPASDLGVMTKATTMPFLGGNMFAVACRIAGISFVRGGGIGGQTSAQIAARPLSDIITSTGGGATQYIQAPKVCFVLMGTNNDITVTNAVNILLNDMRNTWSALLAAGILPIPVTLPPRSDNGLNGWPSYGSTGTYANRIIFNAQVNAANRQMAAAMGLPVIADVDALMNNGAGGYIGAVGVNSSDGVHMTAAGYFKAGSQAIAPALIAIGARQAYLSSNDTDPMIIGGQSTVLQLKGGVLVTSSTAGQPDGYGTSHSIGAGAWTPTFTTEPTDGINVHGN